MVEQMGLKCQTAFTLIILLNVLGQQNNTENKVKLQALLPLILAFMIVHVNFSLY